MSSEGFWSNPLKQTPPQSLLTVNSTGDQQTGPIGPGSVGHLPGTTAGAVPAAYTTAARAVYPWNFDFSPGSPNRVQYDALVAGGLSTFSSWHSLYQARYLATRDVSISVNPGAGAPDAYYTLLADGRTVLNVMGLTLADYQRLSREDRARLESQPVAPFMDFVRVNLGLVKKGEYQNGVLLDTLPDDFNKLAGLINAVDTSLPNQFRMPEADKDVFRRQLKILRDRYDESSLVAVQAIGKEVGELTERFRRAKLFAEVRSEISLNTTLIRNDGDMKTAYLNTDVKGYAISSDNSKTVNSGYDALMRAERAILTAQLRREAIGKISTVYDPKQDVAQLIYQLQLLYQAETDARADAGTEEMAQLHRLLSDYAIIQRLVNETLKAFDPKKTDEKRRFLNIGAKENGEVDSGSAFQSTPGRGDNFINYTWEGSAPNQIRAPNGDPFHYAPAYHWYMLAGTQGNARIGLGIVNTKDGEYDSNDAGDSTLNEVYNVYRPDETNAVVLSGGLTEAEMRIVGMFADDPWGSGKDGRYQRHPIEALYGIDKRAMTALTDNTNEGYGSLTLQRRDYWDKWSTQLADAVTILNQKNQLKQNEIESDTKQSNRHFDLGTNALKKMNEMLMSIGRM